MRLTTDEARHRFGAARVARLATVNERGVPHLVPVTFALVDEEVVFAVDQKPKSDTRLRRLRNIDANPAVSFLVDAYDDDWSQLWWVRADATASIVHGTDRRAELVTALRAKYPQYERQPPTGTVVSSRVSAWRGWCATTAS